MIRGSCLCAGVKFEIVRVVGPFELCHCILVARMHRLRNPNGDIQRFHRADGHHP